MTTTRIRQARFAIDTQGRTFAEVQSDVLVGSKWYHEDPVPLEVAGPEAVEFQDQFGAAQQARIASLTADIETLTNQLAESTATIETLQVQVDTIQHLKENIIGAMTALALVTAERDVLLEKVSELSSNSGTQ